MINQYPAELIYSGFHPLKVKVKGYSQDLVKQTVVIFVLFCETSCIFVKISQLSVKKKIQRCKIIVCLISL